MSALPTPADPSALLAGLQAGDPNALGAVYRAHASAMLRSIAAIVGDRATAEDVLHDVFVGLPEAMRHYRERGKFGAWLHAISVRRALSYLRKMKRRSHLGDEAAATVGRRAEAERLPDRLVVEAALAKLSPATRSVVVLRELDGWPYSDIADCLGISVGAAMTRHSRGLQQLRLLLKEDR